MTDYHKRVIELLGRIATAEERLATVTELHVANVARLYLATERQKTAQAQLDEVLRDTATALARSGGEGQRS